MKKKNKNKYFKHEALDRSWVMMLVLEATLGSHPTIMNNKKYKKKVRKIGDLLADLYTQMGEDIL